jgi:glutaredoxin
METTRIHGTMGQLAMATATLLVGPVLLAGCDLSVSALLKRFADAAGTATASAAPAEAENVVFVDPPFPVRGALRGVQFTWFDGTGAYDAESRDSIPEHALGRVAVRPADSDNDAAPTDPVYVADLRQQLPGGSYAVQRVSSEQFSAWVELAIKRAPEAEEESPADEGRTVASNGTGPKGAVVLYVTNDCSKCTEVREWLDARGIAVEEKSFDNNPFSALEAGSKLSRGGYTTVLKAPVLDVHGTVVSRFEPAPVERLLRRYGHEF